MDERERLADAIEDLKDVVRPYVLRPSFWIGVFVLAAAMAIAAAVLGIDAGR